MPRHTHMQLLFWLLGVVETTFATTWVAKEKDREVRTECKALGHPIHPTPLTIKPQTSHLNPTPQTLDIKP